MDCIKSEYVAQPDGSGVITETYEDGSQRIVVLPRLWATDDDRRRHEDRITKADRAERQYTPPVRREK